MDYIHIIIEKLLKAITGSLFQIYDMKSFVLFNITFDKVHGYWELHEYQPIIWKYNRMHALTDMPAQNIYLLFKNAVFLLLTFDFHYAPI